MKEEDEKEKDDDDDDYDDNNKHRLGAGIRKYLGNPLPVVRGDYLG
jgi:hypothetical protein